MEKTLIELQNTDPENGLQDSQELLADEGEAISRLLCSISLTILLLILYFDRVLYANGTIN